MRIAVSGASGLVGSALCTSLRHGGHQIVRLVRSIAADSKSTESSDEQVEWVPESGLVAPEKLNGCDAFVHLAGRSIASARWTEQEKALIRSSRVEATQHLSRQIASLVDPPRVVVSCSASGFYGDGADEVFVEGSSAGTGFLADVARDWEAACDPLRESGIRVIHPRLGIVLTRLGGALQKMLPIFRLGVGGRLGNGEQYWSWISLDDCVKALTWLLHNDMAVGPYNLVSPHALTNRQFTAKLAKQLRRPAVLPAPAFALRLAMGEMADALLLSSCRVQPARLVQHGFEFSHPTLESFLTSEFAPSA